VTTYSTNWPLLALYVFWLAVALSIAWGVVYFAARQAAEHHDRERASTWNEKEVLARLARLECAINRIEQKLKTVAP
jgi:hypothetical protein